MDKMAKISRDPHGQIVHLPQEFELEGKEVYVRRNPAGEIVLSSKPDVWQAFLQALAAVEVDADFLSPQERAQQMAIRDPLEE